MKNMHCKLNNEVYVPRLSKIISEEHRGTPFRSLYLGKNIDIVLNDTQLEDLFNELDVNIHARTRSGLQKYIKDLEEKIRILEER